MSKNIEAAVAANDSPLPRTAAETLIDNRRPTRGLEHCTGNCTAILPYCQNRFSLPVSTVRLLSNHPQHISTAVRAVVEYSC